MTATVPTADICNKCGKKTRACRMMAGGDTGLYLCRDCWNAEMEWRKTRNANVILPYQHYELASWPGGK